MVIIMDNKDTPREDVHYIPVEFEYTKLVLGSPPQRKKETRHMMFTNFSYSRMLAELGISQATTKDKASISQATEELKEDSIRKGSTMIWASLISEDSDLTVEDVMKMVDINRYQDLTTNVVRAMAYYVHGPSAHSKADMAVEEALANIKEAQENLDSLSKEEDAKE